jgi:hypothetical protein
MDIQRCLRLLVALVVFLSGFPQYAQSPRGTKSGSKPTESEHVKGPHGLEAWTITWPLSKDIYQGEGRFAFALVLARNGVVIRRIEGSPIIWNWIFWSDGQQIAYETGPLHFSMMCVLIDTETGRRLSDYDCYTYPKTTPDWVNALEKTQ